MKLLCSLLAVITVTNHVSAHYCFPQLMVNETITPRWKYVRRSLTPDTESLLGTFSFPPMYDLSSPNIRCGRNSTTTGVLSDVATITAGSKVGFRLDSYPRSFCSNCGQPQLSYFHDGPLFAYLAKSPEQSTEGLRKWDGDGDFFKIEQRGPDDDIGWWTSIRYDMDVLYSEWNFTIPETTPPGFYLLRIESIYPNRGFNKTQFYASCAQVEIVGSKGGDGLQPGPTVKFPGAFDNYDEGVWLREEYFNKWLSYKLPGPTVWRG